jgi:putative CRISPR-associated protein (TIGR02619 family)
MMNKNVAKVFVSPCGTSLLTNQIDNDLRKTLLSTANFKEDELTPEQHSAIAPHIQKRRETVLSPETSLEDLKKMSAELNGLITYHNSQIPSGTPEQHYLLVSDTYQGKEVGKMVAAWLESKGIPAQEVAIPDLTTSDAEAFRLAMSELIQWSDETLTGYRQQNWRVIFSLTGGFKGVNGFLQTIGMFYAHESVYIFQGSSQLLRIPQLPITLDKEGAVGEHLTTFRKLEQGFPVTPQEWETIPETLLFQVDNEATLSVWGDLVWRQAKPIYYEQQLLPPLSTRLKYAKAFEREIAQLRRDRIAIVNKRLDQLSSYLDSNNNEKYNPPSLDFKKIRGNRLSNSTHECDAWSDRDAKRLFGHFENGTFVIDHLGNKLD